ncbi:MAG: transposase, partial [Armatimonadota bacterium]
MPRFKEMPNNPEQMWLLPPSLDEMVPEGSDVRVLSEVMDHLDWSALEKQSCGPGRPAYPPRVMAKILVYAYSKGMRSSRKIEELVECDIRYMWLAGGLRPDFHTIARFRREKFDEFTRSRWSGICYPGPGSPGQAALSSAPDAS